MATPVPKPKKSEGHPSRRRSSSTRPRRRSGPRRSSTTCRAFIGGVRQRVDRWRELPDPNAWSVTPETCAAPDALAQAHRFEATSDPSSARSRRVETAIWLTEVAPTLGKEGRRFLDQIDAASEGANPGSRAAGAEARHRRREDHRHGDDHRLADDRRGAPAGQPAVHARLPGGDPRRDDPRPAAGAPAERSGQLLREPRAGAERHAPRPGAGEDCRHQLPRVPAARDAAAVEGRPRPAPGTRAGPANQGDGRADAAARHAGPDGHEADPGPERRGAPLLP